MVSLLKSFRKKTTVPVMVTSADFQEDQKAQYDPEPEPSLEFNIFGLSLEKAYEINQLFNNRSDESSLDTRFDSFENSEYVPTMILKCLNFINSYGLKEEGLYRMSGSSHDIALLKNGFGQHGPSFNIPDNFDVHAVASLIKMYIRELPQDLLPVHKHTFLSYIPQKQPTNLSDFNLFTQEEEDLNPIVIPTQIIQEILQELSIYNFALIQQLALHFQKIISNSKFNKMTLSNLSIILCHTFKIHKSVFHALVIKESLWEGLHPHSHNSTTTVTYNTNKILHYEPIDCIPELDSNYSDDTQTSFASFTQNLPTITSTNDYYYNHLNNSRHISFITDFDPLEPAFDELDIKLNTKYSFDSEKKFSFDTEKKYVRHPLYY